MMKTGCKFFRVVAPILTVGLLIAFTTSCFAAGNVKRGKRQYDQYCTPCHGKNGTGDGTRMKVEKFDPAPRNHTDGKIMNVRTDVQLFKTVKDGGKSMNFSHIMPQWKHILKDKQIWDVIAYVRSLAKNPEWTGTPIPPQEQEKN
jgi:mono/diheme cytochrome c family protein